MKVIIRQREFEYTSDYPDGWKFVAGDPFKFPVLIGDHQCFVKRFEQKTPEDISGWALLVKMVGKDHKNLSNVYDIRNVQEDGKEIYYVFYEHLDGTTLDRLVRQPNLNINLGHISSDLFNAIRELQNDEFWFADFTEKNIFSVKNGSFVLVDVDSTQRIIDLPINDMYGSKDYWILVLKFYKEILNKNDIRLADINGINLNYLQIPFLVLRLKLISAEAGSDYNSTALFSQLPSRLDKMAPEFRAIFSDVIASGKDSLSPDQVRRIEDTVDKKIIKADLVPVVVAEPGDLPSIIAFNTDKNEIESGGAFVLSWKVNNAEKLELHKNGAKFSDLDLNQRELPLQEFADGTRQQSYYELYAYKGLEMAKSLPVTIQLKDEQNPPPPPPPPPDKWKKLVMAGIGVVILVLALIFFLKKPSVTEPPTQPVDTAMVAQPEKPADTAQPRQKPMADAGPGYSFNLPQNNVLLVGNGVATNATIINYHWVQVSGPSRVKIGEPDAPSTMVTGLVQGEYFFRLEVMDSNKDTASDLVQVVVNAPTSPEKPTAYALDQTVGSYAAINTNANATGTLRGTGTGVHTKEKPLKFFWTQIYFPAGSKANIVNPLDSTTTVTGLNYGDPYVFRLTVTDANGISAFTDVRVDVQKAIKGTIIGTKNQVIYHSPKGLENKAILEAVQPKRFTP